MHTYTDILCFSLYADKKIDVRKNYTIHMNIYKF